VVVSRVHRGSDAPYDSRWIGRCRQSTGRPRTRGNQNDAGGAARASTIVMRAQRDPDRQLRVGVLGAGTWAQRAHVPGWQRDPRAHVAVICDVERDRARDFAAQFGIADATDDWHAVVTRPDLDVIDVVTPSHTHFELAWAALEAGKHVLCEKPVAYDYRETRRAAELAKKKGLKTKLGFTFRYSPGVQFAKSLIDEGFTGAPFIFNGYEQNSQWLDPRVPLRQVDHTADQSTLQTSSLEGYGAPIIDVGHWWVGADYARVVGAMRNFVPERV